jgi:hypothetical protein
VSPEKLMPPGFIDGRPFGKQIHIAPR